ncbi:MAG: phage major capsid protein [Hyalangium sp.]|uniref:phage major capsid protein n=1 Tax=Hyalangium sp. TaxID=2028555 RepID=UPI00389A7028
MNIKGFTPEQVKELNAWVAKRVGEELAARPQVPTAPPSFVASKSITPEDRKKAFARAFGLGIKSAILEKHQAGSAALPGLKKAHEVALKSWQEMAKSVFTPTVFSQGGSLIPEYFSEEIIEVLRDVTVLMAAGVRTQDVSGKFNIGQLNSAAVAQFVLPGTEPTIPTPDTGSVILDPKKLMGVVRATGDMMRDPSWNGSEILTGDMMGAVGAEADKQGLVGDGTGANPTGVLKQVAAGYKNAQTAAFKQANLTSVIADLDKAERLVRESKIPFQGNRPGWIFTSKTLMALKSLRDTAGWVFRQQLDQGTLNGYPYFVTDSISGADTISKDPIFFGLWAQVYLGMMGGIMVDMDSSQEFSKDNVLIRGITNVDIKLRHTKAVAIIGEVTYT